MEDPLILVVDDDRLIRLIAVSWLVEAGYHVFSARDGVDCLEQYERAGPENVQLIILDIAMPLMDGAETFNHLRAINPQARILIHSASVHRIEMDALYSAGALGFIPKPCSAAEFLWYVRTALARPLPRHGTGASAPLVTPC